MKFIFWFLLFFCLIGSLSSEESSSSFFPKETVAGNIHFYGDRYILKGVGKDHGKWFILLESSPLEDMIKELELFSLYEVEGNLYTFNQNLYLLPLSFKRTKNIKPHEVKTQTNKKTAKNDSAKDKKKTTAKKGKKKTIAKKNKKKTIAKKGKKKTTKNNKKKTKKDSQKTEKKKTKKKIEEENL